ncbi:MAG TPA: hypothetical protein VGE72_02950, partial [Azospirillum sp.]
MLETASPTVHDGLAPGTVRVVRMSSTVAALVVQAAQPFNGSLLPVLDGEPLKRPHLISRFDAGQDGGPRALVLVRAPALLNGGGTLALQDGDGAPVASMTVRPSDTRDIAPLADLLRALDPRDSARTLQGLLDATAALFRQQADPDYVATCHALLDTFFPPPGTPAVMAAAAPGYLLCQGALPLGIGAVRAVIALDAARLWRNPFEPALRDGGARARAFDLLVDVHESGGPPGALVLFGEAGVCCRR